jgi:hypothetical protein
MQTQNHGCRFICVSASIQCRSLVFLKRRNNACFPFEKPCAGATPQWIESIGVCYKLGRMNIEGSVPKQCKLRESIMVLSPPLGHASSSSASLLPECERRCSTLGPSCDATCIVPVANKLENETKVDRPYLSLSLSLSLSLCWWEKAASRNAASCFCYTHIFSVTCRC